MSNSTDTPAPNRSSMVFLGLTVLTFLAASAAPTPLYRIYQENMHFSAATLTLIFGVYALSLLTALLTVGSLSDYLGRRPVIFCALILDMLAMGLFLSTQSAMRLASCSNSLAPKPKRVISETPRRSAPLAVKPSSSGVA